MKTYQKRFHGNGITEWLIVLLGIFLFSNCAPRQAGRPANRPEQRITEWVTYLDKRLHLTQKQEQQLQTIMAESMREMRAIRRKYADAGPHGRDAMRVELERLRQRRMARIEQILTPQQRLHYQEIRAEIRERMRNENKR